MTNQRSATLEAPVEGGATYLSGTGLVGRSSAFKGLLSQAARRGIQGQGPLLLVGELGTGKSHLARALHSGGVRRQGPFLHLPLGSIAPDRLELEIFGPPDQTAENGRESLHVLELARGGTVFLHGLPHLPLPLQLRLARALESESGGPRKLPCRVMATALPGDGMGGEGLLLPSLWKVLSTGRLEIPPLRDREGDPPLLARHFLRILPVRGEGPRTILTHSALEALGQHSWPGNVRELRRTVEQAAHRHGGTHLTADHLQVQSHPSEHALGLNTDPHLLDRLAIRIPPEGMALADVEARAVAAMLQITEGNRSRAARILGISRPTLARKIRLYDLDA